MHEQHTPPVPRHWLADAVPKTAPVIATSTVLALARLWNEHGAQHSIGDATLMGALSVGAAWMGNKLEIGRASCRERVCT